MMCHKDDSFSDDLVDGPDQFTGVTCNRPAGKDKKYFIECEK